MPIGRREDPTERWQTWLDVVQAISSNAQIFMLGGRQKVIKTSKARALCVPVHRSEIDQEVVAKVVA